MDISVHTVLSNLTETRQTLSCLQPHKNKALCMIINDTRHDVDFFFRGAVEAVFFLSLCYTRSVRQYVR